MHGNNPTRDAIEQALTDACLRGQIHSWKRLPGYGPHAKWEIGFNDRKAGPLGDGTALIRTYQEGKLVGLALGTATTLAADPGSLAGQLDEQLRLLGDDYDTIRAALDDGDSDLDLLEQLHMTISLVLGAAGRLG
jgi:hypothetical protein